MVHDRIKQVDAQTGKRPDVRNSQECGKMLGGILLIPTERPFSPPYGGAGFYPLATDINPAC